MPAEWTSPEAYTFDSSHELDAFLADTNTTRVIDPIEQIAADLYELEHPDGLDDNIGRRAFCSAILEQGVGYGTWFHFNNPNSPFQGVVRFAPERDHYAMRTFRNQPLISVEEQQKLRDSTIAVLGLSVGSQAVEPLLRTGIGRRFALFDSDRVSVANLNRMNASYLDVGRLKTSVSGDAISQIDPYVRQDHFPQGYTRETDAELRALRPNLIVEEVDDMAAKARVRELAAELGVPLVMAGDVHDKSVLSTERHDKGGVKPFNGRLSEEEFARLAGDEMSKEEREKMLAKIIGLGNVSMRLLGAVPKIGKTIAGMPQLGTTAAEGGVLDAVAARDILLERGPKSGVTVLDLRKAVGSGRTSTLSEGTKSVIGYAKHVREKNRKNT